MSIIGNLKSRYSDWKDKADERADKAIKIAETKSERDKIKSRLAIEAAQRKRAVAKAETEQKEAELARKKANKELKGDSFNFLDGLFPKKKTKPSIRRRRKTVKKEVTTMAKMSKAARSKAAAKAWRTRKRKYGKDGVKG